MRVGGNRVVGERSAAGAVGIAGERIVDGHAGGAEVAGAHGRGGQRQVGAGRILAALGALIVDEEEQLVLAVDQLRNPDRAADRESVLVEDVLVQRAGVAEK